MSANDEVKVLLHKLNTARAALLAGIRRVDDAGFSRAADGGWSAKDIVAHVAAAEELNVNFAKLMVSQDRPVQLQAFGSDYPDFSGPFSLDAFNAYLTRKLRAKSLDEVLTGLDEIHARTCAWAETLTPDQLERRGEHAVWGDKTIRDMLRILALHDKLHTNDILRCANQVDQEPNL
jgi:DinB superfamily